MFLHRVEASKVVSTETVVRFDNLDKCLEENNYVPLSASFACLGHEWSLAICRSGDVNKVTVSLSNLTKLGITTKWWLNVGDLKRPMPGRANWSFGNWRRWSHFGRSEIMKSLVDGALVIKVHIELIGPPETPPFVPLNPSCKIIQGLFMDEEDADVVFEVGGQLFNNDATKKSKTLVTRFPAHGFILRKSSSTTLAVLCRSAGDKTTSPIQISDVSPEVFRHLLFHLYGGTVADDDMTSYAKDILDAADRYGVVDLKLAAEACLVKATAFGIENLKELLLFADSKNCALLKEAAIDFMLKNSDEVYKKISFTDAPGALLSDVLAALCRKGMKKGLSGMRVNDLRWRAHKSGLDVDGSREMLIAALKEDSDEESESDSSEESDEDY
jgi:hypothetical protein